MHAAGHDNLGKSMSRAVSRGPAPECRARGTQAQGERRPASSARGFQRVALLLVALLALAGCDRQVLYSHLDEQQANEVSAALLRANIDIDKRQAERSNEWIVLIAKDDLPAAVALLEAAGLPHRAHPSMGEVFKKEGFVASPTEDKARYLYALSEELSDTLHQIDGVVSARVHVALPDRDLIGDKNESASASVVIVTEPGAHVQERETDIKAIVKDSVEGLDNPDHVTVKFFTRAASAIVPTAATTPDARTPAPLNLMKLASRSDLTNGLLVTFAILTMLAAITLLWWNRSALLPMLGGARRLPDDRAHGG
jgi:type III secretion protein J